MKSALALALLIFAALTLRAEETLQTFSGCTLVEAEWADGDSFPVRLPDGRQVTSRLYGADCIEWHVNDETLARRLRAQRRYFGIADTDAAKRNLGLTALTKWPDATVSERLLDLLSKAQDPNEREILLGSLIRIAPLPDNKLNNQQKLELLQKTMTLCTRDEDRRRVLERANAIRLIETLRFVMPYLDDPNLAEPACLSVVELAHHRSLRDANKDEFTKALDKVLATTKNEELVDRANRYKQGQTWERKKPAGS